MNTEDLFKEAFEDLFSNTKEVEDTIETVYTINFNTRLLLFLLAHAFPHGKKTVFEAIHVAVVKQMKQEMGDDELIQEVCDRVATRLFAAIETMLPDALGLWTQHVSTQGENR